MHPSFLVLVRKNAFNINYILALEECVLQYSFHFID